MVPASLKFVAAMMAAGIAMAILKGLCPAAKPAPGGRSKADLKKEFHRWFQYPPFVFLAFMVPSTFLSWKLLLLIAGLMPLEIPEEGYALVPPREYWILPAMMFVAPAPAGLLTKRVFKLLLKDRYPDFARYVDLESGIDDSALEKPVIATLGVLAALAIWLSAHWYVYFTPDEIVVNRLFRLREERFAYAEVSEIQTAPAFVSSLGKRVHRREYVVRFRNGRSWSTDSTLAADQPALVLAIVRYVSERSRVPIEELRVLDF